jgi:hypothetical protein
VLAERLSFTPLGDICENRRVEDHERRILRCFTTKAFKPVAT